ncbi:MAG: glutamate--tRNA ligase [Planctomycetia bacterium]|nr:MAG: glutamate--tRNA ligase [Planctomycetia bacterium]
MSDIAASVPTVVRTRFAPSPTGYLHIGGARTALFNYLLAHRLGGKFILRIEDTDQARNIERADEKLIEDMRWLGLIWDEGPGVGGPAGEYHQSRRLTVYRQHAQRLLDSGKAYYAFDTREELDAMRKAAESAKRRFRYPRPAQFPSESDAQRARSEGRPVVVRFRMPERDFVVNDLLCGEGGVRIASSEVDDFVILKNDGWPTYHFAVVVDDQDMLVTHVLRGQEHLMNTPNHLGLQESLGFRTPVYAHLPVILNMDGSKMSKREKDAAVRNAAKAAITSGASSEGALRAATGAEPDSFAAWLRGDVQLDSAALDRLAAALEVQPPEIQIHDFRASGYVPAVLLNFISLLGWSPGEDREKMSMAEMCSLFSLERVGRTNARFDRAKLLNFNTTALAAMDTPSKRTLLRDYLVLHDDSPLAALDDAMLDRLIDMCPGVRLLRDVETKCRALFVADDALRLDPAARDKVLLKNERAGLRTLEALASRLDTLPEWKASAIDALVRNFAEEQGLKLGDAAQPVRVAITGTTVSPPLFESLELLGRERSLARIRGTIRSLSVV